MFTEPNNENNVGANFNMRRANVVFLIVAPAILRYPPVRESLERLAQVVRNKLERLIDEKKPSV